MTNLISLLLYLSFPNVTLVGAKDTAANGLHCHPLSLYLHFRQPVRQDGHRHDNAALRIASSHSASWLALMRRARSTVPIGYPTYAAGEITAPSSNLGLPLQFVQLLLVCY